MTATALTYHYYKYNNSITIEKHASLRKEKKKTDLPISLNQESMSNIVHLASQEKLQNTSQGHYAQLQL